MRRVSRFGEKKGARKAGSRSMIVNGQPEGQNRMQMSVREIQPGLRVKIKSETAKTSD